MTNQTKALAALSALMRAGYAWRSYPTGWEMLEDGTIVSRRNTWEETCHLLALMRPC